MNDLAREALRTLLSRKSPALESGQEATYLAKLAVELLAWTQRHDLASYKKASASEELLHPLHVQDFGPACYLVSDGVSSKSPPHEHGTWAVIVGIAGKERNLVYSRGTDQQFHVAREAVVGPGDTLVLDSAAIHSTTVAGTESTFHIHVYGTALHQLAPFSSRTCAAGEA
jgi:predicted metal-dependent enzyme (double-stranded beta helix superfamily)